MAYYNTTSESGEKLIKYRSKASKFENKVLSFFKKHPDIPMNWSDIMVNAFDNTVSESSIKRSINTLFNLGDIVDTGKKKDSIWGRPSTLWRLK